MRQQSPSARRNLGISLIFLALAALLYRWSEPTLLTSVPFSTSLYDRNGELLRLTLAADDQFRLQVPFEEIPTYAREATLLYEDRFFWWHPGFNPVALARAAFDTYLFGKSPRGASTVTMQLARMRFAVDSRSPLGKLQQILRALQLELHYSKREILTAYFNLVPYGGNIQGIGAASLIYFGRPAGELSLAEVMALSVIPQDPNRRSQSDHGYECAELLQMRRHLAARWSARHPETDETELALRHPLQMERRRDLPFNAPHFVASLLNRHRAAGTLTTTLEMPLQRLVERRVAEYLELRREHDISNLSMLLLDHRTMETVALVGSADFFDADIDGQVDGTRAKRSPGSTLKPFIYGLALEQGLIHPRTLLKDAPMRFDAFNPENFDGTFVGPMPATSALVRSRNVPAVYLETQLGNGGLHGFLKRANLSGLREPGHYGLAIVLGGFEVTMEELVELYAMLASRGELRPLRRLANDPLRPGQRLLSPAASRLVVDMLRENPRPGQAFQNDWIAAEDDVAWKTGTSFGFRDAWSVGIVGPFVLAVWVGNFDGRGNPELLGRKAAAPLFFHLVDALRPHVDRPAATLAAAEAEANDVQEVEVCSVSGQLPTPHCPRSTTTGFIPGVSPIDSCSIHREVFVNRVTGLRACDPEVEPVRPHVFEFWPSDLAALFERAGIPRARPPAYPETCDLNRRVFAGLPPAITSPRPDVVYTIRSKGTGQEELPLLANADADVRHLHWFIDEEYLGETPHDRPLSWRLHPGDYVVRVVDDTGRASARNMRVAMVD